MKFNRFSLVALAASLCMVSAPGMARSVNTKAMSVTNTAIGDPGGGTKAVTQNQGYAGRTSDALIMATTTSIDYGATNALYDLAEQPALLTKVPYRVDAARRHVIDNASLVQSARETAGHRSPSGQVVDLGMMALSTSAGGGAIDESSGLQAS